MRCLTIACICVLTAARAGDAQSSVPARDAVDTAMERVLGSINDVQARRLGLEPLYEMRADSLAFELRVRGVIGGGELPMIVIRRDGNSWTATRIDREGAAWPMGLRRRSLSGDWELAWKQIEAIGLLTMPPVPASNARRFRADGRVVTVELRRGTEYRAWAYDRDFPYESLVVRPDSPDDRIRRIEARVRRWLID